MARAISTNRTSGAVAEGVWLLQIVDSEESISKEGNDMVVLSLAVVRNGQATGGVLKDYLTFGSAQWKFDALHDALEIEEGKKITYAYYKGKTLYAFLTRDFYEGRVNNKVKNYLAPDAAQEQIARQKEAENGGDPLMDDLGVEDSDEEITPAYEETRKTAAKRGRPKAAVAELEDEDFEMPPL